MLLTCGPMLFALIRAVLVGRDRGRLNRVPISRVELMNPGGQVSAPSKARQVNEINPVKGIVLLPSVVVTFGALAKRRGWSAGQRRRAGACDTYDFFQVRAEDGIVDLDGSNCQTFGHVGYASRFDGVWGKRRCGENAAEGGAESKYSHSSTQGKHFISASCIRA